MYALELMEEQGRHADLIEGISVEPFHKGLQLLTNGSRRTCYEMFRSVYVADPYGNAADDSRFSLTHSCHQLAVDIEHRVHGPGQTIPVGEERVQMIEDLLHN